MCGWLHIDGPRFVVSATNIYLNATADLIYAFLFCFVFFVSFLLPWPGVEEERIRRRIRRSDREIRERKKRDAITV